MKKGCCSFLLGKQNQQEDMDSPLLSGAGTMSLCGDGPSGAVRCTPLREMMAARLRLTQEVFTNPGSVGQPMPGTGAPERPGQGLP